VVLAVGLITTGSWARRTAEQVAATFGQPGLADSEVEPVEPVEPAAP